MKGYQITMTDSAESKIKDLFISGKEKGKNLRISVEGGGCSGFKYQYSFVENKQKEDLILNKNGAQLIIDPISADLMKGSVIDFVETLGFSSFEIKNPNSTSKCGCGNSFSI